MHAWSSHGRITASRNTSPVSEPGKHGLMNGLTFLTWNLKLKVTAMYRVLDAILTVIAMSQAVSHG